VTDDMTRPDLPTFWTSTAVEVSPDPRFEIDDTVSLVALEVLQSPAAAEPFVLAASSTGLATPEIVTPNHHPVAVERQAEELGTRLPLTDRPAQVTSTGRPRRAQGAILTRAGFALCVLFATQVSLSVRLIWSNTAFEDEALYLWAGHMEWSHWLHQTPIPIFQTYFSGAPVIYPPLAAILDSLGGLAAARMLSLAFILGATALLYSVTTKFFGRIAGVSAATAFALLGPTQVLSALATYDAMAIFLLALASWLVTKSGGIRGELLLVAAGVVLALGDATKYATALWNPIVIGLAIVAGTKGSWLRLSFRGIRLSMYTAIFVAIALFRVGKSSYIHGVLLTTVARQVPGAAASAILVLKDSGNWLWFIALLVLAGLIISIKGSWRTRMLCGLCALALLLAPLHQAQIHSTTSLQKHVAFGAWFGAIAAGLALSRAVHIARGKGWRIIVAVAAVTGFIGVLQANTMFTDGWPDMSQATRDITYSVPSKCPCLMTAYEIFDYYLIGNINPVNLSVITGPYSFYYWNPVARRELSGSSAYVAAIHDHYFTIIELDTGESFSAYTAVARAIRTTSGYHQIAAIPTHDMEHGDARSVIQIWRYEPRALAVPGNTRGSGN
jgi:4-amino-4-deoxy-L-arabinose transferase-like glycosyltransferase